MDILDLFPDRVSPEPNSGCWIWTGSSSRMHGQTWFAGKKVLTHRRSYELSVGPIPDDLLVLHKCDNGYCVNPTHLELGTHSKNISDAVKRGLLPVKTGEEHGNAALTAAAVKEIREFARTPQKRGFWAELAKKYGVDKSTVSLVKRGKSWIAA